ncbi:2EXR family [Microdochium nivale]|nr:2EXR family [Microdochium nivale]
MDEPASSDGSSSSGSPGFYQEGPATSDRDDEGSEPAHCASNDDDDDDDKSGSEGTREDQEDESGSEDDDDEDISAGRRRRRGFVDLEASESGSSNEDDDEDSDDDEEDDEDGRNRRAFIDLEASESGDSDDQEDEDTGITYSFDPFMRLPAELRERVWEFFNPYLKDRGGRVLTCVLSDGWTPRIVETQVLSTIMGRTNAMLAVHRETRDMALKHFPHTLSSGTEFGLIRFHRDRDILLLTFPGQPMPLSRFDIAGVFDSIGEFRRLAIYHSAAQPVTEWLEAPQVRRLTARLDALYLSHEAVEVHSRELRWCFSLPTTTFWVDTEEEEPGLGEDSEYTYCWVNHDDPAFDHDRMAAECAGMMEMGDDDLAELQELAGTMLLPMAEFAFRGGTRRYEKLEARYRTGWEAGATFSSDDEDESGDDEEPNEYESEGIDDDTIDELTSERSHDEADDDLIVRDNADSDDDGNSRPPTLGGSSPAPQLDSDAMMELAADDDGNGAMIVRFSSIEVSDDDDDDVAVVQRTKRSKRSRVVESDSEDDGSGDATEQTQQRPRKMARRGAARIVVSDDSDDDDNKDAPEADSDVREVPLPPRRKRLRRPAEAESSDEDSSSPSSDEGDDGEESSEDEEGEEKPARPQTLAERLRLFRDDNPVPVVAAGSDSDPVDSQDDEEEGGADRHDDSDLGFDEMEDNGPYSGGGGGGGADTFEGESDAEEQYDDEDGY